MRRARSDEGAATLEYAGVLFVVVLVVGSLVGFATPIGSALRTKICEALSASCRDVAGDQRAEQLDVPCVTNQTDRTLGYNVSVEFVRGDRLDTDQIAVNADGSAQVKVSQGGGVGLEASKEGKTGGGGADLEAKARISANGDLAYVYNFPTDYGGAKTAQQFIDNRRGGLDRAVDIVVPGAQTVREGATAANNWTTDRVDDVLGLIGQGPSKQEQAQREAAQRAGTADAVEVSLSLQGEAGVSADGGIAKGEVGLEGEVKGTAAAALTTDGPDKASTSFTGSAQYALTGEATLGLADEAGGTVLPPILNIGGEYGSQVSYQVEFDADGNPTKLVLATETTAQGNLGLAPSAGGKPTSGGVKAVGNSGSITLTTSTLDLTGPQNAANRAAFDQVFTTYGVSAGDYQVRVADIRLQGIPTMVSTWSGLQQRVDADAYEATYHYDASGSAISGEGETEIKVAGYGVGGQLTSDQRQLTDAVGRDNRTGGVEQSLATCE